MSDLAIKNVTVLGAGQMGREIALNAAVAGYSVFLYDNFDQSLKVAKEWGENYLSKSVAKGKMTQEQRINTLSRVAYSNELNTSVSSADLLIESIIEKETIKRELFQSLKFFVKKECLITTNSSFLPSSCFIEEVAYPENLANLHYFNPAMRMNIVEIVRGAHTSDQTVDVLKTFVESIGKISILVSKEIQGFVVNRLLRSLQDESFFLLENGVATFEEIDLAAEKGLNHPMGPFRLMDFTGLDTSYYSRQATYEETQRAEDKPPISLEEKVKKGHYGRKSGKGWYKYK